MPVLQAQHQHGQFLKPHYGSKLQNVEQHVLPQRQLLQVCSKQFIRETGDLRKRINNHRSTKKINKSIMELFNVRFHKWEDITVVLLTIILIGRTRRGKARKTSGFTDLNHSDLIAWTSNLTTLESHSLISPDTYVVILSKLSTAFLSVILILYHFSFIFNNYQYFFILNLIFFRSPSH